MPVTRIETIASGQINYDRVGFVDVSEDSVESYRLRKGDILLSHINSVPHIGKVASYDGRQVLFHGMNLMLLRWDAGQVDHSFGYHLLSSKESKKFFEQRCQKAVSQASLNRTEIGSLNVSLPPLPEQRKIAAILSAVDAVIERTQAVIDQLQQVKKALMQELLTRGIPGRHTRFKQTEIGEVPEEWEVVQASDICETIIDCKNRTPPYTERGFPVIRTTNVRDGSLSLNDIRYTDYESYKEWTKRGEPRSGDILITREAPVGEVCLLPEGIKACLGQRMMLYRTRRDRCLSDYLVFALQSENTQKRLDFLSGGSTVGHIRVGDIRSLPVPIPGIPEQIAISNVLRSVDQRKRFEHKGLTELKEVKLAMMSVLLSGEVRVKLEEGAV